MANDGAYFDQFERTFTQQPQQPQTQPQTQQHQQHLNDEVAPFSSFLYLPNEPEDGVAEQEPSQEQNVQIQEISQEINMPEPLLCEPPSVNRFQGVVDYLKHSNAHRDTTEEDANLLKTKYMTRLILHLLKGKPLVNIIFGELDPMNIQDEEMKKILGTIKNANEIIDQDETSQFQLSLTNTVMNSIVGLVSQKFPHLDNFCSDMKSILKQRFEHSHQKDYQIHQLNYLAHYGKLDGEDKIIAPVSSVSRTHDFISGLIIPVSLIFADQIGKEFINGSKPILDRIHETLQSNEPPHSYKRLRVN